MVEDYRRRFWVSLLFTIPVVAFTPLIQQFFTGRTFEFVGEHYLLFVFASIVFFYGGWPFLTGFIDELRSRQPGMMTLIALAISVAYIYSSLVTFGLAGTVFFWETATLIDVVLLGQWIETRSVIGASRALEALVALMPSDAHRLRPDGSIEDVPLAKLSPGDRVLVKPGEKVPVDGRIVEGRTTVNQALLTGESRPVEKGEGDAVIGASINGESAITVAVEKTGKDTYLSQVIHLVREAQESRSRTQDLADKAAQWLTIIAVVAGTATLGAWLTYGETFQFAIERLVTVVVITCPHALGFAIPLVVAVSTALAAADGLLIRDRQAFEQARAIQTVVFDKTGTLTEGRFGVTDVIALADHSEADTLAVAASLESRSEHPIAAGIVRAASERGLQFAAPAEFSAIPGKGARGIVNGKNVKVVSSGFLIENGLAFDDRRVARAQGEGKTVVFVLIEDQIVGAIALADIIRSESREALRQLKAMGIQTMMITGDSRAVAQWVAKDLALDDYFAEVLPDQKSFKIKEIKARGVAVAMVGDGVNDAPALVEADVGIAIGAGTDVAIEAADIVLVSSDPAEVPEIVRLSRATYRKMVQNLWWATGYNAIAIPLAAGVAYKFGVLLSPAIGAVLMSASTIVVAINAQLLARFKSTS